MRHLTARNLIVAAACLAFVTTVWAANYLIKQYGPIRVWPTSLYAPAGVYVVGVAFLLRDTIQRLSTVLLALACIAAGTVLTFLVVDQALAWASAAGFVASEIAGLTVFFLMRGNKAGRPVLGAAVVCASVVAAAVDSFVFLSLAPERILGPDAVDHFFKGQFVAKIMVTALAIPFVLAARKKLPEPVLA